MAGKAWSPARKAAAAQQRNQSRAAKDSSPDNPAWKMSPTGLPITGVNTVQKVYTVESGFDWKNLQLNQVFAKVNMAQDYILKDEWPDAVALNHPGDYLARYCVGNPDDPKSIKIEIFEMAVRGEI